MSLGWTNPEDADLSSVAIRRLPGPKAPVDPSQGLLVADILAPANAYTDNGLTGSTTYTYALFARDGAGNYSPPAPITVTTAFAPLTWAGTKGVAPSGDVISVSCPTTGFCAALDIGGYVLLRQAGTWSKPIKVGAEAGYLSSVSCVSAQFCVATFGRQVGIFNGTAWSVAPSIRALPHRRFVCQCLVLPGRH